MRARDLFLPLILGAVVAVVIALLRRAPEDLPEPGPGDPREHIAKTRALIANLEVAIAGFERQYGDYPPSSSGRMVRLRDSKGDRPFGGLRMPSNSTNVGTEMLHVCLHDLRLSGAGATGWTDADVSNADQDQLSPSPSLGMVPASEFADGWGNPLVYVHHRDYGKNFKLRLPNGDSPIVTAQKSARLRKWHRRRSYQLYSMGPDGKPGTTDDIRNW